MLTTEERIQAKVAATIYGVKTVSIELKDLDEGTRTVSGYLSDFDSLDSDNDVIRKGAFKKSIQEHGVDSSSNRKVAHLRNHDWEHQIGAFKELKEDSNGLFFVSALGRSTKGNDAFLDYQDGILREHSIGFNYVSDKIKFVEESDLNEGGHFEINEVKLWEGSAVTFGANSLTPVIDVAKGETSEKTLEKLQKLCQSFKNALTNGKGTDERLERLELRFAQIEQIQKALFEKKPLIKSTFEDSQPKEPVDAQKSFYLNILKNS